jgi:hypothetical protein
MAKKEVLFLLMLLIFCMPSSVTKNGAYDSEDAIVLSERIGSVVDPDIRMRYNLFPDLRFAARNSIDTVVLFIEARFYRLGKGGYIVKITTANGTYQAQNGGAKAVAMLQNYFSNYDSIVYCNNKKSFEKKWGIVDYDMLGLPITMDEVEKLTKPNPRLKYGGLGAMIAGAVIGGYVGCTIGTWVGMFKTCLLGIGVDSVGASKSDILIPTLTCAGLGAIPGAATMIAAEVMKKKYDDAVNHIKHQRMPYFVPKQ